MDKPKSMMMNRRLGVIIIRGINKFVESVKTSGVSERYLDIGPLETPN
jgi:hypothetical protein